MRVNLAREQSRGATINRNILIMIGIFLIVVVTCFGHYYFLNNKKIELQNEINSADNKLKTLQEKSADYNNLKNKIADLEEKIQREKKDKSDFPVLTEQNWNIILAEIGNIIPENVMINSLNINNTDLSIRGIGRDSTLISRFFDNLIDSKLIKNVKLQQLTNGEEVSYVINAKIETGKGEN